MPKQHGSKTMIELLSEIRSKGFTVHKKTKTGTVKIIPPEGVDGPIYHTHATESAIHQIRRDFARLYNVRVG
jgi:hypothetical protein